MKVLAAIVTYNRSMLLSRCINSIENQVRKPDDLIVVNNASTDDTESMLLKREVRYVTQPNTGAAGGWYRCIEIALQENFDMVWLMDDDGYSDPKALLILLEAFQPTHSCLSSIVVKEDSPNNFVFPFPILDSAQMPVIFRSPRKVSSVESLRQLSLDDTYPFVHLFNGALISTEAIKKIGNVNKGYFIYGEEVDYFFRLRQVGEVRSVISALHFHPDVTLRTFSLVKIYYYLKNSIILNKLYYDKVLVRSILSVGIIFTRIINANGYRYFISLIFGRYKKVSYTAIHRGFSCKIGRDDDFEI